MNEQKLSALDFPFQTSNAALALSLYLAGIPFHDPETPLTNTYNAETLKRLGYKGDIETAAKLAFEEGVRGHVDYGFKQTVSLGDCVKAFDAGKKSAKGITSTKQHVDMMRGNLVAGCTSLPEAIAFSVSVILCRWREELPQWEHQQPFNLQRQKHAVKDYNGAELIGKVFTNEGFYEFAAVVMDTRPAFLALFRNYTTLISLHLAGSPKGDEDRVRMPGFLYYNPDTENPTRRDLGIPTK